MVVPVQFITQQLLGNPLSSPPHGCPYQQSWVATSQQNSANPFLLWGSRNSSEDEETIEKHNSRAKRLLQTEKQEGFSLPKLGNREGRVKRKKVKIKAEKNYNLH